MRSLRFAFAIAAVLFAGGQAAAQTCTLSNTKTSCTVAVKWTPSITAGVTQTVYRETAAGACLVTSAGTGPGCWKLTAAALDNTVTTFSDSIGSNCPQTSASCAVPGTYRYVVRATSTVADGSGNFAAAQSAETNAVTVSLPPPTPAAPTNPTATIQ